MPPSLMLLSTAFQLYREGQLCWERKQEYPEKTTDLPQITDKCITLSCIEYTSPWRRFELTTLTLVVKITYGTGSWKSIYHAMMNTTALENKIYWNNISNISYWTCSTFLYNIIVYVARSFLWKKSWKIKGQSENRRGDDYTIQWLMEKKTNNDLQNYPFYRS
jgi:hypothetical protein